MTNECRCLRRQLTEEANNVLREAVTSRHGFATSHGERHCPCKDCKFTVPWSLFYALKKSDGEIVSGGFVRAYGVCSEDAAEAKREAEEKRKKFALG